MSARDGENILRLEIAVDDALGMGGVQPVSKLDGQLQQGLKRQGLSLKIVPQCRALEILHHNERFVHHVRRCRDTVQMLGWLSALAARASRFKRVKRLRMLRQIMGQELQSYQAVQFEVLGFIDIAHSAAAQESNNPETSREDFTR